MREYGSFDWEAFGATPLSRDPYEHVVVNGFVKREALQAVNDDYPEIQDAGSFRRRGDLEKFGPGFRRMVEGLESEEFRKAFQEKFRRTYPAGRRPSRRAALAGGDGTYSHRLRG